MRFIMAIEFYCYFPSSCCCYRELKGIQFSIRWALLDGMVRYTILPRRVFPSLGTLLLVVLYRWWVDVMVQCPYRDLWKAPHCLSPPHLTSLICFWNASSHLWLSCDNILYKPVIEFCRQVSHWFLPCWPFMHGRNSLKRTAVPSQFPEISPKLIPLCSLLTLTTLWPCVHWNYISSCYET